MNRWLPVIGVLFAGLALAETPTKRPNDAERGKTLYQRHCAACHGPSGKGDGPAAAAMVKPIPDLTGKVTAETREAQIRIVLRGKGVMPAFEQSFEKEDAKRVLTHLISLTGGRNADAEEDQEEGEEEVEGAPPEGGEGPQ